MWVIALSEVTGDMVEVVGGKAAGLGELIRAGERVPAGFCVTTAAHDQGTVPEAEVARAYEQLGGGPVAVRSSATAEDLPDASFAGQQDTLLGVTGLPDLLAAIRACWDSLHHPRAVAYRDAHGIDHASVRMAVVVQRMVDPATAGVLFTANPLTGCRTETVVEAAPGLGTAVVDGATAVDRYVLDDAPPTAAGPLTAAQLTELRATGHRLQRHLGAPQDVEWAYDHDGVLWLLQSRPITTLFPLPPDNGKPTPRVYLEFGHVQGMLQPATPMGMSSLKALVAGMLASFGLTVEVTDIGGRLYGDLTDLARDRATRKRLVKLMAVDFGPRAQAVMEHVLADPRFAPAPRAAARRSRSGPALRTGLRAVSGVTRSLARPDAARDRLFREVEQLRLGSAAPAGLRTAAERLEFVRAQDTSAGADDIVWPIVAGMLAAALPPMLLAGVASRDEINTVLAGMPHNVTLDMDLALWRLSQRAGDHRELLLTTPPSELAARYAQGTLPDIGLADFLDRYGHRAVAEVDVGVPRWDEDPTPVFAMIANYLRVTDPEQAPDRRFARAAATAEATLAELLARARRRRPVRGRLAGFLLRRARALAGLREAGKFAGLYRLREMRRQLLLIGADLTERGLLAQPGDVMFLTLDETHAAVHDGADHRATVAARQAVHRRELRRRSVPVAVLSDGTDVEAVLPARPAPDGALLGVGAAAGRATGPARVVHDPATARLEPGEVLVAPTTDPGWTPLFLTAAALVTETGAVMAHGPTVAREYGIPAVICVPEATRRIRTGQLVTVDAAAGTVTVEDPDAGPPTAGHRSHRAVTA
ncbi:PEP/pyruvate-binding domain-containing protein [Micromonospora sp. C28SCA-DRY-2]|uniref:PEP/pyruvate-binding domain-containing protein n=1 Tax=Micromonospora sp. C28SCA-DRY-2 TaxID=3059522 RepID=UPI00267549A9|nr:PEP/pyruvate-binding domain-containing protein [Micromonospora sp. C28SCA-DRY-2]MDO3703042.1 PEP/pyruvate-binding domain-containing protein [Micromonospora sp. C28SCA-DRY-2]